MPRVFTTRKSHGMKYPAFKMKPLDYERERLQADATRITEEDLEAFKAAFPGVDRDKGCTSLGYVQKFMSGAPQPIGAVKNPEFEAMRGLANQERTVLYFRDFFNSRNEYCDMIEFDGPVPILTLRTDYYKLWDAVSDFTDHRRKKLGCTDSKLCKLDNGWYAHGVRLLLRYATWRLTGVQDWWAEGEQNDTTEKASEQKPVEPIKKKRARSESTRPPEAYKRLKQVETKAMSTPPDAPKSVESDTDTLRYLGKAEQLDSYCGCMPDLVDYARHKYGQKPGGMPTSSVRRWFERNPERLPAHLHGRKFGNSRGDLNVCHVISKAKGGHDFVWNFGIYTREVNSHFDKYISKEWDAYVGPHAVSTAQNFARWVSLKAAAVVGFGDFNPVSDYCIASSR